MAAKIVYHESYGIDVEKKTIKVAKILWKTKCNRCICPQKDNYCDHKTINIKDKFCDKNDEIAQKHTWKQNY